MLKCSTICTGYTCSINPIIIWFSEECDELDDPGYGYVVTIGNLPGDKAVYFCDDGFTMKGEKKRKCVDGGMWDGKEPTCESKFH